MKTFTALGTLVAAAILASCVGQTQLSPSNPAPLSASGHVTPALTQLLYVADDSTSDVYYFDYPSGVAKGTLTGFNNPKGACVDTHHHLYFTSAGGQDIQEYKVGGTTAINYLSDKPGGTAYTPIACAVDASSGDVAAANMTTGSPASITIWPHGDPPPVLYTDSRMKTFSFLGYNPNGKLFVDGVSTGNAFQLVRYHSGRFTKVTVTPVPVTPGNVQWTGNTLAVGDQSINGIYAFSITGNTGTAGPPAYFTGACDIEQFFINTAGTEVVGPDNCNGKTYTYAYPGLGTGGAPLITVVSPYGTAIQH
jgi:hypothetical protein